MIVVIVAIPINLLKDEIILKPYQYQNGIKVYKDEVTIKNVRIQFDKVRKIIDGAIVEVEENILFVDKTNSKPFNLEDYTLESVIKYKDKEYKATKIEIIDNDKGVNHLEITLT